MAQLKQNKSFINDRKKKNKKKMKQPKVRDKTSPFILEIITET